MATRADIYARPDGDRPAIYLLIGPDPSGLDRVAVYVGECDSFAQRFRGRHHAEERAEWAQVFVATTTDGTLNKAHALFVEDYLRRLIVTAGLATDLTERSASPTLDEGDRAFAESFAEDTITLCKVLGIDIFSARSHQTSRHNPSMPGQPFDSNGVSAGSDTPPDLPIFVYGTKGVIGRMQPSGSSFVLLAGSTLSKEETRSMPEKAKRIRDDAVQAGLITDSGNAWFVAKDMPLDSVSLAAWLVAGNAMAGRALWTREGSNETYLDWYERRNSSTAIDSIVGEGRTNVQ